MHGLILILALGVPQGEDDVAGRVRALVERLNEDDIDAVDRASAELFRLGPAAVAFLQKEAGHRGGDVRLRIDQIIRRIEREARLQATLGSVPSVTLDVRDRPLKGVLEELSLQSGIPVEGVDVPGDLPVRLKVEGAPLWEAVDRLCRDAGTLMYALTPHRVLIRKGAYRALPRASHRGFLFLVDGLTWNKSFHQGVGRSYFTMQSGVFLPPGARPVSARLEIDSFRDDKGTVLAQAGSSGRWAGRSGRTGEGTLLIPLHQGSSKPPAEDATKIDRLQGRVVLTFALKMNRVLSIENPEEHAGRVVQGEDHTVLLKRVRRTGKTLRVELDVTRTWSPGADPRAPGRTGLPAWKVVVRDGRGKELEGQVQQRGSSTTSGPSGRTETRSLAVSFTLDEGAAAASLHVIRPEDFEEVTVPFDFEGLPFGKVE